MNLRDGTKKMSKSDESDMTRINLTDDSDQIAKKIRKAKTDPEPLPSEVKGLEMRPEADNLVGIYAGLAETSKEQVLREFGNAPFSKFKEALAELATTRLTPIGEEMRRLMADPVEIDRILAEGARRAHAIADPILAKTKDIVGFIRS
jgi:tryptophanyl-tRNA synthetase